MAIFIIRNRPKNTKNNPPALSQPPPQAQTGFADVFFGVFRAISVHQKWLMCNTKKRKPLTFFALLFASP
jgi:hypothetical protein